MVSTWCWSVLVATLFLVLEAISFLLELNGRNRLGFRIASFFLSAIGFGVIVIKDTKECDGNMTELVLSLVQLITTWVYLVLPLFKLGFKFTLASIYPLVLAATAFVLAFRRRDNGSRSNAEEGQFADLETRDYDDAWLSGDPTREFRPTVRSSEQIHDDGLEGNPPREADVQGSPQVAMMPQSEEIHIPIHGNVGATKTDIEQYAFALINYP